MPNGKDKQLNFTLKVWDAAAGAYRPAYIAPDATDKVQGDVKLSDATNSTANAASGMTAATPAAVKAVADVAGNKLDKLTSADQTVASKVTFNNSIIGNKGITVPSGQFFTGNLNGNATTATTLQTARTIALTGRVTGSASFNGGANASIATAIAEGSIKTVDIADNAITSAKIADGAVTSADVDFNYAGSSSKGGVATSATKLSTARTISLAGDVSAPVVSFDGTSNVSLTASIGAGKVTTAALADGAVTSAKIADGTIASDDVDFNYAGSSTKGGDATRALNVTSLELKNEDLNYYYAGDVRFYYSIDGNTCANKPKGVDSFGMFVFRSDQGKWTQLLYGSDTILYSRSYNGSNGFPWTAWKEVGYIPNDSITYNKLADNAVVTSKISTGAVTSAKIADGTIVAGDIADSTITGAKMVNSTITGAKIAASTITATNIANSTITNAKMAANSINSSNIVDRSITGTDIATNTIALGNLANDVITQLNGKAPVSHTHDASNITSGTLSITRGGTGATDAATARANLGLYQNPATIGDCNSAPAGFSWYTRGTSNRPTDFGHLITFDGADWKFQIALGTYGGMWWRSNINDGGWTKWSQLANNPTSSSYYAFVPIYRLHNSYDNIFLFTASESEYNDLVSKGWTGEGVAFYAFH